MTIWWVLPAATILAVFLTGALRRYALVHSLMDLPNARSSHSIPTPRGGGVAIVASFSLFLSIAAFGGGVSSSFAWALLGAGLGIAFLGFLDDHGHIIARWRLVGHFSAAVWILFLLDGLPPIVFSGYKIDLGWFGHVVAAFYLVWLLNLYNFMDGIDGIASFEAVCVSIGAALCYVIVEQGSLILAPLTLAFAVLGFLYWNFPRARIFMGDAGSGFLGIILGGMSIQAAWAAPQLFWCWLILLGVFIVDATFTLVRRLLRGDKVYEAHRSHAYQHASRFFKSHSSVTLAVIAINVLWLMPISVVVAYGLIDGFFATLLAYTPLVYLAIRFHAGELESQKN
ncbi:MraY family glycosyltransferase [Pseudomonas segetis]|uniref:Fuc2NAc and GlcNAc transferase n=1 Tax=Pseudomonas segetis TaxID=298908 RepID=A0A239A7D2_9PSED|nr:glycosyltransferase family 4 protein [Pseudomonas segetis]SNR90793.1 Fuc2NAc and GlcNAc transferase [Pseudomonas segetis]